MENLADTFDNNNNASYFRPFTNSTCDPSSFSVIYYKDYDFKERSFDPSNDELLSCKIRIEMGKCAGLRMSEDSVIATTYLGIEKDGSNDTIYTLECEFEKELSRQEIGPPYRVIAKTVETQFAKISVDLRLNRCLDRNLDCQLAEEVSDGWLNIHDYVMLEALLPPGLDATAEVTLQRCWVTTDISGADFGDENALVILSNAGDVSSLADVRFDKEVGFNNIVTFKVFQFVTPAIGSLNSQFFFCDVLVCFHQSDIQCNRDVLQLQTAYDDSPK